MKPILPIAVAVILIAGLATLVVLWDSWSTPSPAPTPAETHGYHLHDTPAPDEFEDAFWVGLFQDDAEQDLLPGEEATPAPHDMLAEITPDLSPEILERERGGR